MKYWISEHVYNHPWHTVANAALRKYPNPMNDSITAIDVIQQEIKKGVLLTERILQSHFHIPGWATKLTGFSGTQYSHEYTEIDPVNKIMTLHTRNLNCLSFLCVDEKLTYSPDSKNSNYTILRQKASVTVNLPAFTDYCEKTFLNYYQTNALKGRKGLEWVINYLKK